MMITIPSDRQRVSSERPAVQILLTAPYVSSPFLQSLQPTHNSSSTTSSPALYHPSLPNDLVPRSLTPPIYPFQHHPPPPRAEASASPLPIPPSLPQITTHQHDTAPQPTSNPHPPSTAAHIPALFLYTHVTLKHPPLGQTPLGCFTIQARARTSTAEARAPVEVGVGVGAG